jgi:phosphatidylinositol kinase/protein kinase (PI-3  family)
VSPELAVRGTKADPIGVFRKAAEISLQILRTNSESLMTVLEAFVHDPLVEWVKVSVSPIHFSEGYLG